LWSWIANSRSILSNVWSFGFEINYSQKFMAKLFNDGLIDVVKERQADVFRQQNLRYLTNENFNIFYGFDVCSYESLSSYADGWVCGTGNLFAAENKKLFTLIKEGKLDNAFER
jgi:dihydrodipicolinate synthase/N-acetylneuraminate lyase